MRKYKGDLVYLDAENATLRARREGDPDEYVFRTEADLSTGDIVVLDMIRNEVVAVATGHGPVLVEPSFPLRKATFTEEQRPH